MTRESVRIPELDSLRGFAALAVAIVHSIYIFKVDDPAQWGLLSALGALSGSQAAVILFFVLSGYVLTGSFDRSPALGPYVVRRIVRLMPAVIVSVLFTWLVIAVVQFQPDPDLLIFPETARTLPSVGDVLENAALMSFSVNTVTWTIRAEMIGSLLIPLLLLASKRVNMLLMVAALFAISLPFRNNGDLGYVYSFALGAALARGSLDALRRPSLALVGAALIIAMPVVELPGSIERGVMALGCTALIGWAATTSPSFLRAGPSLWLGKVSYSFYLFHPAAMLIAAASAYSLGIVGFGGAIFVLLFSIPLACIFAEIMYRAVEKRSMIPGSKPALTDGSKATEGLVPHKPRPH